MLKVLLPVININNNVIQIGTGIDNVWVEILSMVLKCDQGLERWEKLRKREW